jgi:hypothetical protein
MAGIALFLLVGGTILWSALTRPGKRWLPFAVGAVLAAMVGAILWILAGTCAGGDACLGRAVGALFVLGLSFVFAVLGGLIWFVSRKAERHYAAEPIDQ